MSNALDLALETITVSDLGLEDVENPTPPAKQTVVSGIKNLRKKHHRAAELLADGKSVAEVAFMVGYTPQRVTDLQRDPAFIELVSHYRSNIEAAMIEFREKLSNLGHDAIDELQDRMEEAPEKFTNTSLMELAKFVSDRTGHGPASTTTQNVNIGIGARLQAAQERLRNTEVIDVTPENNDG